MLVYSGHDSTLVPLLCGLGCYDGVWPPYASYLALEIVRSKSSGERFVRAVYNDQEVSMGSCGHGGALWVPLASFYKRLSALAMTAEDYKGQCVQSQEAAWAGSSTSFEAEVKATIG